MKALEDFGQIPIKQSELSFNLASPLKQLVFDETGAQPPLTAHAGLSQTWLQFNIYFKIPA